VSLRRPRPAWWWCAWAGAACLAALAGLAAPALGTGTTDPRVAGALQGGLMAALATAAGSLPVLFARPIPRHWEDSLLGFGAGVMLAASVFSLALPALAAADAQGHGRTGAALLVATGIVLGAIALLLLERVLPETLAAPPRAATLAGGRADAQTDAQTDARADMQADAQANARAGRRAVLFVAAIALHNLPEGLAIGAAFAGDDQAGARSLAIGISVQDIPEGFVVAMALWAVGYGRLMAALIGALSGLSEPVAALVGAVLTGSTPGALPWGLSFAAGAMLCVICHEVVPESHRNGHARWATSGLMLGFVLMMVLDTTLG
jgi:ZIP family zinc transporter